MCGIFGYSGNTAMAGQIVIEGLKRLDYRGYDSWGVAVKRENSGSLVIEKHTGKISEAILDAAFSTLSSHVAIAHTRWATTGRVNDVNAHPHVSTDGSFALAQNGIVENYLELKTLLLKKGYSFISETDTEVIVRLIEEKQKKTKKLLSAVTQAFLELDGRNTIILITQTGEIIAARNGSPLVIGLNPETEEVFLSSDTLSFSDKASQMMVIDNGQMVLVKGGKITVTEIANQKNIKLDFTPIGFSTSSVDKEGFSHYMLKEINQAPEVISRIASQESSLYERLASVISKAQRVYTIGSGGAGVAAAQVAFYLREIGKIPATSLVGADAVEYQELFTEKDLIIAISQSGETADVLEVLEPAKKKGARIASFVNMPGSMITRISDYPFMSESGPEICVMSTKTFDAQVAFGYRLAKTVIGKGEEGRDQLEKLSQAIEVYLKDSKTQLHLEHVAKKLSIHHDIFLLGKYQNFHIIREGMVKVIEASYLHGHALPAGDLKHYVITLMEPGVAVVVVMSEDRTKKEVLNAVDEVKLRGAEVIGIAPANHHHFDVFIPVPDTGETSAMMNLIPLQLIAYHMAVILGNNVDKPRNIAKSVTVK